MSIKLLSIITIVIVSEMIFFVVLIASVKRPGKHTDSKQKPNVVYYISQESGRENSLDLKLMKNLQRP